MRQYAIVLTTFILNCVWVVTSKSFYSVIIPGSIKQNRKCTAVVSLHESEEPLLINVRIEGPFYYTAQDVHLEPYQTKSVVFDLPKLPEGRHVVVAESLRGFKFRNESFIGAVTWIESARIYLQTDKAIYKPGDEVQFRVILLDEHTRPLQIEEPILVEILDASYIRVKQFKNIQFVKGIYKGKFSLSEYPVLGYWQIKVSINGNYQVTSFKQFQVQKYVLPKFSISIQADDNFIIEDRILKCLIYGKYTFDKYVEGNLTAALTPFNEDNVILQEKKLDISNTAVLEFTFDDPSVFKDISKATLRVALTEKHTGITRVDDIVINIRKQRFQISLDTDSIQNLDNKSYQLKAKVRHWNDSPVWEREVPIIMKYGSKEYKAYLDDSGEALFKFEYDKESNHIFEFKNSTLKFPNIFLPFAHISDNGTENYCKLRLKGAKPRLGSKLEVEVYSDQDIPYIIYTIMGHSSIIKWDHIKMPANQKNYTIEIMPSIEMIPQAFLYVHYVQDGNLRYDELALTFPMEFENRVSVAAPKEVSPGEDVTLEIKAQPKSYVGLLAVDLGVYLLDSSYDLRGERIMNDLKYDVAYTPTPATVYPGILSGALTLTNAHYTIVLPSGSSGGSYGGGFGAGGGPSFRNKFPETWIFENYEVTNETTQLALTVPDSITTWRITAFSLNDVTGFGIVDRPTDIIALKSFFINLNLPYSVKRGEQIKIRILVFNYNDQSVDTEITLYNEDGEFEFIESTSSSSEKGSKDTKRLKRLTVPENGVEKVEFIINPTRVGEISLRVTAENAISTDAVIRKLKVEPDGRIKRENKPLFTSLTAGGMFNSTISTNIPADIVPESEYLTLSVGGDSLVPTLKNLNNLVHLPTGCGEQNMVNFVPNILVLQYLKATGKYFKERGLVSQAKKFIEIGYQQQLSYRHRNGGYSVFGPKKDNEASTWLTAYVIRSFIKVSKYMPIEDNIIETGLEYLAKEQEPDGYFRYTGYLFYTAQRNGFAFAAFVLLTFMESEKYSRKYENVIKKGLSYLSTNLDDITDIYALAIVANALQMAKHEKAQQVIDTLKLQKQQKDGHIWWTEEDRNREKDVEITAYALLALLGTDNDATEDLKILQWLIDQRNGNGGFKSTHDTVVGLQALVRFSEKYNSNDKLNMKIRYTAKNDLDELLDSKELTVDANNLLLLQTNELPRNTRSIDVNVSGSGSSLVQLTYRYHLAVDDDFKHFQIDPKPMMANSEEMVLEVCFKYQEENTTAPEGAPPTNMIIMEANLPSGFITNDEFSNELLNNEIIHRIESKNSETTLVIYFKKIAANVSNCLHILGAKVNDVLQRKPAAISVYDFYNKTRQNTAFYKI